MFLEVELDSRVCSSNCAKKHGLMNNGTYKAHVQVVGNSLAIIW